MRTTTKIDEKITEGGTYLVQPRKHDVEREKRAAQEVIIKKLMMVDSSDYKKEKQNKHKSSRARHVSASLRFVQVATQATVSPCLPIYPP